MPTPEKFYSQNLHFFTEKQSKIKSRLWVSALLRLSMFVVFLISLYYILNSSESIFKVFAVVSLILFIVAVRYSLDLKEKKNWADQMVFINANELNILANKLNAFDNGSRFLEKEGYSGDLDVFGKNSLFHLLNRTTTSHGTGYLADLLSAPPLEIKEILSMQQSIKAFTTQPDIRHTIIAHGLLHRNEDDNLNSIYGWLNLSGVLLHVKWIRIIRYILPVVNIFCLYYYLATDNYYPVVAGIFASWIVIGIYGRYINRQHVMLARKQAILNQYTGILNNFARVETAGASLLLQLSTNASAAASAIKNLSQLAGFFDQRLNVLVNFFLNSFFLYDIQCMIALEKWKEDRKHDFGKWIELVGQIECLNSLATFQFNNPDFVFPRPMEGNAKIEATNLAHPLIPSSERIGNDLSVGLEEKVLLITGSNMSGKTTFLRSIGVNLILAQCGTCVCASTFEFTPMKILTSIRVNDSLQEHTSYFMAELQRLQHIIIQLKTGHPAIVLVDEILKGTNSEDKTYGSETFIRKLLVYNCVCLFATHDLQLSSLEKTLDSKLKNYCFESNLLDSMLTFDYRLQRGIAKNKNASFLMQKMGIID